MHYKPQCIKLNEWIEIIKYHHRLDKEYVCVMKLYLYHKFYDHQTWWWWWDFLNKREAVFIVHLLPRPEFDLNHTIWFSSLWCCDVKNQSIKNKIIQLSSIKKQIVWHDNVWSKKCRSAPILSIFFLLVCIHFS